MEIKIDLEENTYIQDQVSRNINIQNGIIDWLRMVKYGTSLF